MTISLVTRIDCPTPPYTAEMVDIDTEAVPSMLYGIWLKSQKYYWSDADNARQARSMLAKQGAALLMPASIDIVNAIDRLYVLQAAAQMGITYYVSGTGTEADPFVYDPPLVQAQEPTIGELPGLLSLQVRQIEGWFNLLNGATTADFPDSRNVRQQLDDILAAISAGGYDDSEVIAKLIEVIALLGA